MTAPGWIDAAIRALHTALDRHAPDWRDSALNPVLLPLYTLLVLTKGVGCTREQVYLAWATAHHAAGGEPLDPGELSEETAAKDEPFAAAIREAAAVLARDRARTAIMRTREYRAGSSLGIPSDAAPSFSAALACAALPAGVLAALPRCRFPISHGCERLLPGDICPVCLFPVGPEIGVVS
ncbi:MAG: DUF7701 domain-containing protein [Pseudonocardiaceae bacterium]